MNSSISNENMSALWCKLKSCQHYPYPHVRRFFFVRRGVIIVVANALAPAAVDSLPPLSIRWGVIIVVANALAPAAVDAHPPTLCAAADQVFWVLRLAKHVSDATSFAEPIVQILQILLVSDFVKVVVAVAVFELLAKFGQKTAKFGLETFVSASGSLVRLSIVGHALFATVSFVDDGVSVYGTTRLGLGAAARFHEVVQEQVVLETGESFEAQVVERYVKCPSEPLVAPNEIPELVQLEMGEDVLVEHTRRDRSKGRRVEWSFRHRCRLLNALLRRRRR